MAGCATLPIFTVALPHATLLLNNIVEACMGCSRSSSNGGVVAPKQNWRSARLSDDDERHGLLGTTDSTTYGSVLQPNYGERGIPPSMFSPTLSTFSQGLYFLVICFLVISIFPSKTA